VAEREREGEGHLDGYKGDIAESRSHRPGLQSCPHSFLLRVCTPHIYPFRTVRRIEGRDGVQPVPHGSEVVTKRESDMRHRNREWDDLGYSRGLFIYLCIDRGLVSPLWSYWPQTPGFKPSSCLSLPDSWDYE
jgi:hypothetical protein